MAFKNRENFCLKIYFYLFEHLVSFERLYECNKNCVHVYIYCCRMLQFTDKLNMSLMVIRFFSSKVSQKMFTLSS